MKRIIALMFSVIMTSCTYSITMVHTEGTASDVVDEVDSVTPSTNVTVPVKGI